MSGTLSRLVASSQSAENRCCPWALTAYPPMTTKPSVASLRTLRILMISVSRAVRYPGWLII